MRPERRIAAREHGIRMLALAAGFVLTLRAAPEPRWISAADPAPAHAPSRFTRAFRLAYVPSKAWVRVHARDRYRLAVNGRPVSVGDTPWDAESFDTTPLVRVGDNMITVDADADVQSPDNCFIWLRRRLSAPAAFERLSFRTRAPLQPGRWRWAPSGCTAQPTRISADLPAGGWNPAPASTGAAGWSRAATGFCRAV